LDVESREDLYDRLREHKAEWCSHLEQSIKNSEISVDIMNSFVDTKTAFKFDPLAGKNPEAEPWIDETLHGFQILVICLYLGANEISADHRITKVIFDAQCGAALRRKGFRYTFVCSYGKAISELRRS